MRIMRFPPKISDLFNIRMADRGRPHTDLTHRLGYPDLMAAAEQVLQELIPIELEVQDASPQSWRARPSSSAIEIASCSSSKTPSRDTCSCSAAGLSNASTASLTFGFASQQSAAR